MDQRPDERRRDRRLWAAMLIFTVLIVVAVVLLGMRRERAWKQFAAAHNCQVIAHRKGDVDVAVGTAISIGPGTSPQVSTIVAPIFEDDKIAWKCDDGRTYWR